MEWRKDEEIGEELKNLAKWKKIENLGVSLSPCKALTSGGD